MHLGILHGYLSDLSVAGSDVQAHRTKHAALS